MQCEDVIAPPSPMVKYKTAGLVQQSASVNHTALLTLHLLSLRDLCCKCVWWWMIMLVYIQASHHKPCTQPWHVSRSSFLPSFLCVSRLKQRAPGNKSFWTPNMPCLPCRTNAHHDAQRQMNQKSRLQNSPLPYLNVRKKCRCNNMQIHLNFL